MNEGALTEPNPEDLKDLLDPKEEKNPKEDTKFTDYVDSKYFRCVWCEKVLDKEELGAAFTPKAGLAVYSLCKRCFFAPRNREEKRRYSRQVQAKITSLRSLNNPQPKKSRKK